MLGEDGTDETRQKVGAKTQLKVLAPRLAAARQAYAASKANTNEDLAGRVRYSRSDITEANDASFASIITALLKKAAPLAKALEKREFTAEDRAETTRLLARFEKKQTSQRTTVVAGATDCKTLIAPPCCAAMTTSSRRCGCSLSPTKPRSPRTRSGSASRAIPSSLSWAGAALKATRPPSPPPKLLQKQRAPPVAGGAL